MPAPAARSALRQSQFLFRRTAIRHSSSTSEATAQAAAKSKDAAASATSKASEGLSKVTSSAGPAISGALQGAGNALKKVGGRTGRVIAFTECKSGYGFRLCVEIRSHIHGDKARAIPVINGTDNAATLALIPPTIYYTRVGIELSKLVFRGQKMAPP